MAACRIFGSTNLLRGSLMNQQHEVDRNDSLFKKQKDFIKTI
jgi:hypothetical protein